MAPPILLTPYVNGSNPHEIVLPYNGQLDAGTYDTPVFPDASDFGISGAGRSITKASITGNAYAQSFVTLEINDTRQSGWIGFGEAVYITYNPGTNPLKNADGNCASFSNVLITNNVKDPTPVIESVSVNNRNNKLWTVILNRPCVVTSVGWTFKINGNPATINNLTGYGTGTLFFETVESVNAHTDTLSVDYDSGAGMVASVQYKYPIDGILYMASTTGEHVVNNIPNPTPDHIIGLTDAWEDMSPSGYNILPGQTIGIQAGQRNTWLGIWGVNGTKEEPIKIVNHEGIAYCGNDTSDYSGIGFEDGGGQGITSSHFIITGHGGGEEYGLRLKGSMALHLQYCTDYEVTGVQILGADETGIVGRTNAGCSGTWSKFNWFPKNHHIHNCKVENTGDEGFYIGTSHFGFGQGDQPDCDGIGDERKLLWEAEHKGHTRIYNNIINNTNKDGLQYGSAVENCEVFNNRVTNYALTNTNGHSTGVQINPGSQGLFYDNFIADGPTSDFSYGIFMTGGGYNLIYNNKIVRGHTAMFMHDNGVPVLDSWCLVHNNTIVDMVGHIFAMYGNEMEIDFKNNILAKPGVGKSYWANMNGVPDWTAKVALWTANNYTTQVIADVKFVDEVDYELENDSPAKDAAVDLSAYGIYIPDQGAGEDAPVTQPPPFGGNPILLMT